MWPGIVAVDDLGGVAIGIVVVDDLGGVAVVIDDLVGVVVVHNVLVWWQAGGHRRRCGVTWQWSWSQWSSCGHCRRRGDGRGVVVSWPCSLCITGRRRSSVVVVELAWPKRAVTRAFDDDNGGDNGGNGVEL